MEKNWDGSTMPSMQGKIALVTGANQGIGFVTAQRLAERGAHVVLACRIEARGREAVAKIRAALASVDGKDNVGQAELMIVDVGELASVKKLADSLHAKFKKIDLLVNNAGVGVPPQTMCPDGYSIQFGVNYLGHFYLTSLVMDLLMAATESRVISISSVAHRQEMSRALLFFNTNLDFDNLPYGGGDPGFVRYEKSKLCNLIFAIELDRRLKAAGVHHVKSIAAHPGVCYTNIFDETNEGMYPSCMHGLMRLYYRLFFQSGEMGALPILYSATMPDAHGGQYYGPDGRGNRCGYPTLEEPRESARSEEHGRRLWELSEQLTKTAFLSSSTS